MAGLGRAFYVKANLRRDTTFILQAAAATVGLLFVEGYAAEKYHRAPRGNEGVRRSEKEGTMNNMREIALRPGVLGGLVGLCEFIERL